MKTSKTIAKVSAAFASVTSGLYLASASFAQANVQLPDSPLNEELMPMIFRLINWAIGFAAVLSVVVLIGSGYLYITAAGDEGKVEKATKTLTFAIIGLVICFISVILVQFVLKQILKV